MMGLKFWQTEKFKSIFRFAPVRYIENSKNSKTQRTIKVEFQTIKFHALPDTKVGKIDLSLPSILLKDISLVSQNMATREK